MPGWLQGLIIVALFLIVRRMFNRPDRSQRKPRRRTVESICRKMKIRVDDKSAYCLLCHCVVAAGEAEPQSLRAAREAVKPLSDTERMVQAVNEDAKRMAARNKAERDASTERIRKTSEDMERIRLKKDRPEDYAD